MKIILLIVVTVFMIIGVYFNKRIVIPSELKLYKRMTYLLSLALLLIIPLKFIQIFFAAIFGFAFGLDLIELRFFKKFK